MAFIYEKSATWRKIVNFTRQSPLYMAGFAGVCLGLPVLLANTIQSKTNNAKQESELERHLRARSGIHHEVSCAVRQAVGKRAIFLLI